MGKRVDKFEGKNMKKIGWKKRLNSRSDTLWESKVHIVNAENNSNTVCGHKIPKADIRCDVGSSFGFVEWTSQILLDTFNSYNVTSNRGVYEQRQTVYRRV